MGYYVNRFNEVTEIDDENAAKKMLLAGKLRQADKKEIADYMDKMHGWHSSLKPDVVDVELNRSIYYKTVRETPDGYGMSSAIIARQLKKLGMSLEQNYEGQKVGLLYSYPYGILQMQTPIRLVMTMFESDKIPSDWPDYLKQADEVIVPSKWCQSVFAKSGVNSTVVPLGFNQEIFRFVDRPVPVEEHKDFVFLHYNGYNMRKGFREVVMAFSEEFRQDEPAKLIIKTTIPSPPLPLPKKQYPNIEVIAGMMEEIDLLKLHARSNCFVYPSRGEGFGITPLEAMATGLPAIVPNAHGISEYFDSNFMLEVKADERCPGLYSRFQGQDVGEMVVCSVSDLRRQMRYAYNHQAEMKELGKSASRYVQKWTYAKTAERLQEILLGWQAAHVVERRNVDTLIVERV